MAFEMVVNSSYDRRREYPYIVVYPRPKDWWNGRWPEVSGWCADTFGGDNWEYAFHRFYFRKEEDRTAFILRWM